jgi:hypothetical protein
LNCISDAFPSHHDQPAQKATSHETIDSSEGEENDLDEAMVKYKKDISFINLCCK